MDGAGLPRAVTSFASADEQSLLASLAHQNPYFCSKIIVFVFFLHFYMVVSLLTMSE